TDGLSSSTPGLLVPVGDAAASQVVGRELHLDLVAREDPDVVLAHLPGDLREHVVALSVCTRNIVLGSASTTSPSTSIFSSLTVKSLTSRAEKRARQRRRGRLL